LSDEEKKKSCAAEKDDWQAKQNMKSLSKGEWGREGATCFFLIVFSTFLCRSSKKRIPKGKNEIQKTNFNLNFLFPRNGRSNWAKLKNVIYWLLSLFCYLKKWPMRIIKGKWCFWANLNNIVSNMKRKKMYCTYNHRFVSVV